MRVFTAKATLIPGLIATLIFFILGVSLLLPASNTGASGAVIGIISVAFAAYLCAMIVTTSRVTVNSVGMVYWHNLRRKEIPWSSAKSFRVGVSRSLVHWPCLVVVSDSGTARVDGISGNRAFVEKIISELQVILRDHDNESRSASLFGWDDQ
jgi:hypothetical protein